MKSLLMSGAIACALFLGACSSTSTLSSVYTLTNTYYASKATYLSYIQSGGTIDAETQAKVKTYMASAETLLKTANEMACPEAFATEAVPDAGTDCNPTDADALQTALDNAAEVIEALDDLLTTAGVLDSEE